VVPVSGAGQEAELEEAGKSDGFVHLELGELALVRGEPDQVRRQFDRAWQLLSGDANYAAGNVAELARMKGLAGAQ